MEIRFLVSRLEVLAIFLAKGKVPVTTGETKEEGNLLEWNAYSWSVHTEVKLRGTETLVPGWETNRSTGWNVFFYRRILFLTCLPEKYSLSQRFLVDSEPQFLLFQLWRCLQTLVSASFFLNKWNVVCKIIYLQI